MATGRVNVGSTPGKRIVNIFAQLSTPTPRRVGDIWIKTDANLNVGDAIFREGAPVGSIPNNIPYIQLRGARIKSLGGDGLGFVGVDEIIFGDDTVDENDTLTIWTDKKYEVKAKYYAALYRLNDTINSVDAYFWNGSEWEQFSWGVYHLYYYGSEPIVNWVQGVISGPGFAEKHPDHLQVSSGGSGGSRIGTIRTEDMVNLDNFSTLHIVWENVGSTSADNLSYFFVGTEMDNIYDRGIVRLQKTGNFEITTDSLDISTLTGEFYISIQARDSNSPSTIRLSDIKVYEIWAE